VNTDDLYVDTSAGNVGIGTTTPNRNLQINNAGGHSILQLTSSSSGPYIGDGLDIALLNDNTAHITLNEASDLYFGTNATERMRITSTGLVGIGTTSPDRLLHAESSDAVTNAVTFAQRLSHISSGTVATSFGTGVEYELENASGTNRVAGTQEFTWTDATNATEDTDFVLKLIDGGTLAERLRVTSDGNINLGGQTAVGATLFTTNTTGGASNPGIIFDTAGDYWANSQQIYSFRENGTEFLSIDGIGNVKVPNGSFTTSNTTPESGADAFLGHGMRRANPAAGFNFAWGESIVSTTEPGIDLFPIGSSHITNGILFRLSKDSARTDVALQINGDGGIGVNTTPTSDYLFNINGNTTNDNSRILNITQSNNADEDSSSVYITATPTLGAIAASRTIRGSYLSLTPSLTIAGSGVSGDVFASQTAIDLSSVTLGNTTGAITSTNYGNNISITGTPVYNDTLGGDDSFLTIHGINTTEKILHKL
jgi:hypothetical protein